MFLEAQIFLLRILLAIGLYGFLALVALVAWRELRASAKMERPAPESAAPATPQLIVVDEGMTPWQAGDALPLRPVTSLGRALSNTIVIPDPGTSAEHALIALREGQWWLEDLGSTNGTFLNETRLNGPALIAPGDLIRIGRVQFKFT